MEQCFIRIALYYHYHFNRDNNYFSPLSVLCSAYIFYFKALGLNYYLREYHSLGYIFQDNEKVEPSPNAVVVLDSWEDKIEVMNVFNVLLFLSLHTQRHLVRK